MNHLGDLYFFGRGVPRDHDKARYWCVRGGGGGGWPGGGGGRNLELYCVIIMSCNDNDMECVCQNKNKKVGEISGSWKPRGRRRPQKFNLQVTRSLSLSLSLSHTHVARRLGSFAYVAPPFCVGGCARAPPPPYPPVHDPVQAADPTLMHRHTLPKCIGTPYPNASRLPQTPPLPPALPPSFPAPRSLPP
jgi:hypothetical protein